RSRLQQRPRLIVKGCQRLDLREQCFMIFLLLRFGPQSYSVSPPLAGVTGISLGRRSKEATSRLQAELQTIAMKPTVMKFGGTSVEDTTAFRNVTSIVGLAAGS